MKTAVSIPDEVFRQAERIAKRMKKSRSELYADALAEYLARREPAAVTAAINEVVDDIDVQDSSFVTESARASLGNSEW